MTERSKRTGWPRIYWVCIAAGATVLLVLLARGLQLLSRLQIDYLAN